MMTFKLGVLLLVSYVSRSSALPPCVCARNYLPVCGSDGRTYSNECLLTCAQLSNHALTTAHQGECNTLSNCICTFEYKPVCGSDGETYPNRCSLGCQRAKAVRLRHEGPCRSEALKATGCICSRETKPVCGSDGVTYANPCLLNCQAQSKSGLSVKHVGPCDRVAELALPSACACTRNLQPVCGTDGVTYNNLCLLGCAARDKPLAMKSAGPCDDSDAVKVVEQAGSCACTRNFSPVCGSDGHTYPNPCMLRCAASDDPALKLTHPGACGEELTVDVVEEPVY